MTPEQEEQLNYRGPNPTRHLEKPATFAPLTQIENTGNKISIAGEYTQITLDHYYELRKAAEQSGLDGDVRVFKAAEIYNNLSKQVAVLINELSRVGIKVEGLEFLTAPYNERQNIKASREFNHLSSTFKVTFKDYAK